MKIRLKRLLIAVAVLCLASGVGLFVTTDSLSQFGASPSEERLKRMKASPNFRDGSFINPIPTQTGVSGGYVKMLRKHFTGNQIREPEAPLEIVTPAGNLYETPPLSDLRVTWLGHSTALIEIDGQRLLTDPVWAGRCSPVSFAGPARFHPVPLDLAGLPPLDAVIISHDHYDHLDKDAVLKLAETGVRFYLPLGVGAHLESWGVAAGQIVELDWWQSVQTSDKGLTITACPGRHFSGRNPLRGMNRTQWASWAILGPEHRVFFSGDTGWFAGFAQVGTRFGPFDLTLIKVGAYDDLWPDIHLNPEQGVAAHLALKGRVMLPIHWGTFNLANHDWFEPPERVLTAARERGVKVMLPRPGQAVEPEGELPAGPWWREYINGKSAGAKEQTRP